LIAEDNKANQGMYADFLAYRGFRIVLATNGLDAIQRATQDHPDLILMDIQMPVMDGLDAIRRLRANPEFPAIPIVALTALAMPGDRERGIEAGADAYLTKPVHLSQLAQTINGLLNR
jgi:CheY-like chemotaxis protein